MRIAALDLGTNSFCLLLADARPDGTFVVAGREKVVVGLGPGVAAGRIPDDVADAAVDAGRRLAELVVAAGADEVVACATSAFREAANGSDLADRLTAEAGIGVEVISGRREAELIFSAVRSSVVIEPAPALCLDLGGGSLELAVGDASELMWAESVHLGAGRLTAELVTSDPPSPAEVAALRSRVRDVLGPLVAHVAEMGPRMVVVTSGSLCDQVRMAAAHAAGGKGGVPATVNQLTVDRRDVEAVQALLLEVPTSRRRRVPGIEARRAELAPAASVVLLEALDLFGFDAVTAGEWGLREGIVLDAIARHDPVDWSSDPRAIRRASATALARRCGWDEQHSTHVATLATALFDALQPLHGLGPAERELLELAAILHDIGEHVSVEGHDRHSAYLVEHGSLRGCSPRDVDVLASIVRSHRRSDPKPSFPPFARLGEEDRDRVRALAAILRVADGLDRSHAGAVERITVDVCPEAIEVQAHAEGDVDLELWGARRKRALLERVAGRRVEIERATAATQPKRPVM